MTGKYTRHGTKELDQQIDADLNHILSTLLETSEANQFMAIALMGGYGRGEGTPYRRQGKVFPYNDYDLMIVGKEMSYLKRKQIAHRINKLEKPLSDELGIHVDLAFQSLNALKSSEHSLMNYELKKGHKILWGEADALSAMPQDDFSKVPLMEGTRLLMNRGDLLFSVEERLQSALDEKSLERVWRYLLKNYLAFGDCILIIKELYDIHYSTKEKLIEQIGQDESIPHCRRLIELYHLAIAFKQYGDKKILSHLNPMEAFDETRELFNQFFLWYEGKRLDTSLQSIADYVKALEKSPHDHQWLKAMALNFILLKRHAVTPSFSWLFYHPRLRCFPALLLLMQKEMLTNQEKLLEELTGIHGSRRECIEKFQNLRKRLA